ncbi:hypothetical protein NP233_g10049 [Leucocoprinus birnbaumii]|uniref:Uncharacterized protein n=1 Tax=Leucocoprinus birnbaumii TaxID=56174 RepID=A0AAD5VLN8_9AGAR|nr:hypothetical protein NP233_g10049 [Leucocoprinus birnbaumii]
MEGSNSSYAYSRGRMNSRSPPSPAASSPSLTQSASNSSSSPPQPSTPPKQPRPRYPDLGRVPLHRRGTSQTYERLEDLLREAGYKETRIFTPESDKAGIGGRGRDEDEDADEDPKKRLGVGAAVVGFLTGLVTGGGSGSDHPEQRSQISRNQSPLRREASEPHTPPPMVSSAESLNDPTPKAYRRQQYSRPTTPSAHHHQYHHHHHQPPQLQHLSAAQRHLQHQASRSSIHTAAAATVNLNQGTNVNVNASAIHQPRPSRAGTYLRHIVPPEPHPRPNSTPIVHQADSSDTEPSLPRNWLDNVARAILFGVASTGASTTATTTPPPPSSSHQRPLRATRSSLSQTTIARGGKPNTRRSGLSDQTNTIPPLPSLDHLAPPALFTRLERGRASCSQSVLKAQVVCRSAPASRASSTVRSGDGERRVSSRRHMKEDSEPRTSRGRQYLTPATKKFSTQKKPKPKKKKHSKKDDEKPRVPSLARTRIEGDGWHALRSSSRPNTTNNRPAQYFSDTDNRYFASPESSFYHQPTTSSSGGYTTSTTTTSYSNSYSLDSTPSSSEFDHDSTALSSSPPSASDSESDDDSDSEEEGEGELTLARMLVNPKRQHSIQSLRKHLHRHVSNTSPSPLVTTNDNNGLNPSLSRLRQLHNSSSTSTLRSTRSSTRIPSTTQSRSDLLLPPTANFTAVGTGAGAGVGVGGGGEWETEWRKGKYSSRKSSEDDNEVESLIWLNRDDISTTGSQRSVFGSKRGRLGLPGAWSTTATGS